MLANTLDLIQQSLGKAFWSKMQYAIIQRDAICVLHPCPGLGVSVRREEARCGSRWTVISASRSLTPCVPAREKIKNQGEVLQNGLIKNRVGKG